MAGRLPGLLFTALLLAGLLTPAARGQDAAASANDRQTRRRSPVVEVFQATQDAVVNISSTSLVRASHGFDDLFDQMFDVPRLGPGRVFKQTSVGSGFVIHEDGYIVTNAHVVARTAERKVIFADKREYDAAVIALDEKHDLAILKIDTDHKLKPITLGASADLMVGETVIAIGNPLGYQNTVTAGVISALNRTLEVDRDIEFTDLIQTDASINPGNSGGPLLNVLGELVGINTAIRADAQNIGFAIPVDHLRQLLPEMLDVERRYRINVGLTVEEVTMGNGQVYVGIKQIAPDSPAAADSWLDKGEWINAIDEQPVRGALDFYIALIGKKPGDRLKLTTTRGKGPTKTVTLTIGERPRPDGGKLLKDKFGIVAEAMTDRMARSMGMRRVPGLMIMELEPNSPADRVGVKPGDVIIQLGRHQPASLDDVGELLETVEAGQSIRIGILRVKGNVIIRDSGLIVAR